MIGGRRRGRGFSRRAPAGAAAAFNANVKVTNTDVASYTGPIDFGLSINPNSFNPSTERLVDFASAQETGYDTCRWVRATKIVTVNGSTDQIITIQKETGAQTTPTTTIVSDLLALDGTWTPIIRYTDTSDAEWEIDLRDVLTNGSTTFNVNGDYISSSFFRDTSIVKELVVYAPFRAVIGGAVHPRLAIKGSVIFYSADNFSTRHSIALDLSITNSRRFVTAADNQPVVGELEIEINSTPVVTHLRRSVGNGDYSTSNQTLSNWNTASFTLDDAGKLLIADGGFEMPLMLYVSGSSMESTLGSQTFSSGPLTNGVLWPLWVDPGAAIPLRIPDWPQANPLIVRQKTQEIRDHMMMANNPAAQSIQSNWISGDGILAPNKISGSPAAGHMHRNTSSNELYEDHGFKIMNTVDGDGYVSPATYDFLLKADETAGGVVLNGHFIDQATGLYDTGGGFRIRNGVYDNTKYYGDIGSFASHQSMFGFVRWVLTGKWTAVRDVYMRAKAQQLANYPSGGSKNIITSGFWPLGAPSGSTRETANYLQIVALSTKAMPTTVPGGALLPGNADLVNWVNTINYEATVDQFGIGGTKTESELPQWSQGMPFVANTGESSPETGDFNYPIWTLEYISTAMIDHWESGILTEKSKRFFTMLLETRVAGLTNTYYTSTSTQKTQLTLDNTGLNTNPAPRIPHATAETPQAYWDWIMNNLAPPGSESYLMYKTMPMLWAKEWYSELYSPPDLAVLQEAITYILAEDQTRLGTVLVAGGTDIDWATWSPPVNDTHRILFRPRS